MTERDARRDVFLSNVNKEVFHSVEHRHQIWREDPFDVETVHEQARAQFAIENIGIVHRVGRLEIGETSVVISVAAPHRRAAFEACEWLIKELKRTVPIWKKEVFRDGEVWIEGDSPAR